MSIFSPILRKSPKTADHSVVTFNKILGTDYGFVLCRGACLFGALFINVIFTKFFIILGIRCTFFGPPSMSKSISSPAVRKFISFVSDESPGDQQKSLCLPTNWFRLPCIVWPAHGALELCLNSFATKCCKQKKTSIRKYVPNSNFKLNLIPAIALKVLQEVYYLMISSLEKTLISVTSPLTLCSSSWGNVKLLQHF